MKPRVNTREEIVHKLLSVSSSELTYFPAEKYITTSMQSFQIYRVFICNCHFLYLSDGHLKTKKSYNPIIFVNLIYGHFDILRSQYGQVKKVVLFRSVPK